MSGIVNRKMWVRIDISGKQFLQECEDTGANAIRTLMQIMQNTELANVHADNLSSIVIRIGKRPAPKDFTTMTFEEELLQRVESMGIEVETFAEDGFYPGLEQWEITVPEAEAAMADPDFIMARRLVGERDRTKFTMEEIERIKAAFEAKWPVDSKIWKWIGAQFAKYNFN